MIDLIERHRTDVDNLCRKYNVKTLELFGSAADGVWDPLTSDLDFLVEFQTLAPGRLFDNFFDLKDELQTLFARRVDLVSPRGIRNPYLLKSVNQSRQVLYAA
jgi:predicted nucleotidyltransferase